MPWPWPEVRVSPEQAALEDATSIAASRATQRAWQPLVPLALAAGSGIAIDRLLGLSCAGWWLIAAVLCLWTAITWLRLQPRRTAIGLLAITVALAGGWHHLHWSLYPTSDLGLRLHEEPLPLLLEVEANETPHLLAARPPDPLRATASTARSRLRVTVLRVRDGHRWQVATGQAILTVEGTLSGIAAGDTLQVACTGRQPPVPRNPGEFNYREHLRADRVTALLRANHIACVRHLQTGSPYSWQRQLDLARCWSRRQLAERIDAEQSGVATALLLGGYDGINPDELDRYVQSGVVHVLSISGLHVGMVAGPLFLLLASGVVPRRIGLLFVALLVLSYCLLTEAAPPVVRATVLVLITCGGHWLLRPSAPFNGLALAGLTVCCCNPAELFRLGPQLSFLSVAALAACGPWVERWQRLDQLDRLVYETRPLAVRVVWGSWRWIVRGLLVSLVVWGLTLPLVMARFHVAAPVAVLLNLLLCVPVAGALFFGLLLLPLAAICPPLANFCGLMCQSFLTLLTWLVDVAHALPGSHFWTSGPNELWLAGFYLGAAVWLGLAGKLPLRFGCAALSVWICCGLVTASWPAQRDDLRCTFLSVGHGVSVVLELPDGRTVLYDAGQLGSPDAAAEIVAGYLWSRGIVRLDAILISHADLDHYNAIPTLVERFEVGAVYLPPQFGNHQDPGVHVLLSALEQQQIPTFAAHAGDRFVTPAGLSLQLLHPPPAGIVGSDNAHSLVLEIEQHGQRILLTGDLESPGLEVLLAQPPRPCQVLLAPHHGSPNSRPELVAEWAQPEVVIVSRGARSGSEPTQAVFRAAGAEVFWTQRSGAVTVTLGKELQVQTFLGERGA